MAYCSLQGIKNRVEGDMKNMGSEIFRDKKITQTSSRTLKVDMNNIKKIWVLKVVLDLGSFRKASQVLKITPAAVSQNLRALEELYKQPLVIRHKNGTLSPSQDAQELIEKCESIFSAFNRANVQLKSSPRIDYIELGIYEALSYYSLPPFFERLKKTFSHIKIKVYSDKNYNLLKYLRQGKICSALLVAEPSLLEDFYSQPIFESEMGFYVSTKSHLKLPLEEALDRKKGLAMLTTGEEGLPYYMSKFLNQFPFKLEPSFIADSYELLYQVTLLGENIAILPKYMGEKNKKDLVELKPASGSLKETGKHQIFFVSEKYCDKEEAQFLAQEMKAIWST